MDKKQFAGLLAGVRQMGRHMHGKPVPGARVTKVASVDLAKIRAAAHGLLGKL